MSIHNKLSMPSAEQALPGRDTCTPLAAQHFVNGHPLRAPLTDEQQEAIFGLGCFWGAERLFWGTDGVYSTSVGYAGGLTPNPNYEEVCSGMTGHTEVVRVVFDSSKLKYDALLKIFWESHDPTQGMQQGNDVGTQYRSAIYTVDDAQQIAARSLLKTYQNELGNAGLGSITTEILPLDKYYYAEDYHQQYLAKNPGGYCGIGGTGVSCPIGLKPERQSA